MEWTKGKIGGVVFGIVVLICITILIIYFVNPTWLGIEPTVVAIVDGNGRVVAVVEQPQAPIFAAAPPPAPVFAAPPPQYRFIQGRDSGGNDIRNAKGLANNVPALKAACTALPNCLGFNTNAWLKHTLKPENQWSRWTQDPNKGFYKRLVF